MRPLSLLLLVFLAIPLLEVMLLIRVGGVIGALPTVALVVLTAVIGVALLRRQGLATLQRVQQSVDAGRLPALEMVEGVGLLLAGAFLLTPGFFTDALGFALLAPALRRLLAAWVLRRGILLQAGHARPGDAGAQGRGPDGGSRTIEGEYRREDE
ncbi:MAG: FxsA family protein [Gammaproteobacteria bacterium]|nr:FxsA family protein [Gammaproteobacteria bacterium]